MKYDFLIVGAGLFGAVFAREAHNRGKKCLVVEKRANVGGNCYTEVVDGITVHRYGAHIFHTSDEAVWNYVNKYAHFNPFINCPLANYMGKLYHLPFNMNTFYELWGTATPQKAREKIAQQIVPCENPKNVREQALALVVTDIYNPVNQFELPGTMNMVVDEVIQNMNQVMYDHAEEYDYHVVDLFESEICEHTQRDGLHPDQEGQRLIAGLAMEKIDTGRFMGEPEKEIEKTEPARKSIGRTILGNIRKVILLTTAAAVILIAGGIAVWRKRRKKTNTPDN